MKTQYHILLAFPFLALVFYLDWVLVVLFIVSNALMDFDHIINFWLSKNNDFDLKKIYRLYADLHGEHWSGARFYFPFHSLELVFLIPLITWFFGISSVGIAIGFGMLYHFVFDIATVMVPYYKGDLKGAVRYYSFFYRWKNDFSPNMFPADTLKGHEHKNGIEE